MKLLNCKECKRLEDWKKVKLEVLRLKECELESVLDGKILTLKKCDIGRV